MSDILNLGNDEIWVIVQSSGVIGDEGKRVISDFACVLATDVKGGRGIMAFAESENVKKYIQDSEYLDVEPVKVSYMTFVASVKALVPKITCLINDPIYGYEKFRTFRI